MFFVCLSSSEYVFITPLGVVYPGPGNITVSCTTQGSHVQVWSASDIRQNFKLLMGSGAGYMVTLNNSCTLTLLYTNISAGQVMTSNMTCPAQVELNGTVFTCKTGGGEMNQTTLWFGSDLSPPSQPKQPGELHLEWVQLCKLWTISLLLATDSASYIIVAVCIIVGV